MVDDYYSGHLFGEKLKRCYDIAPPRVRQYLEAEITYTVGEVNGMGVVLELGCGYGRVMERVCSSVGSVVGIDTSGGTLQFGSEYLKELQNCYLVQMNVVELGFASGVFDAVLCIQNGLSAFHVDSKQVVKEAVRVTRRGGLLLFSSYSPKFWEHRLEWFRLQSKEGLVGEIDEEKTKVGKIVCKDGFTATLVGEKQFLKLFMSDRTRVDMVEVDESSVFARVEVVG